MEPEAAAPGDTFVTKGRVRLAEAVRHLVDATLTAEDASSEQLASAAHLGPGSALEVRGRRFNVVGVFHTGVAFENAGAMIDLGQAQQIAGLPGEVTTIAVVFAPLCWVRRRSTPGWPLTRVTPVGTCPVTVNVATSRMCTGKSVVPPTTTLARSSGRSTNALTRKL